MVQGVYTNHDTIFVPEHHSRKLAVIWQVAKLCALSSGDILHRYGRGGYSMLLEEIGDKLPNRHC
jgi:hypothetical protein